MRSLACIILMTVTAVAQSDTVSLRQLQKLPEKSQRVRESAERALRSDKKAEAIAQMERLVALEVENAAALHDLGVLYLGAKEPAKAAQLLEKAISKEPSLTAAHVSLALAYLALERFAEAEAAARRSLLLAPRHSAARFLLGKSLVLQGRYTQETLQFLRQTQTAQPEAHLWAAKVLMFQGELDRAREDVAAYLQSGDAAYQDLARTWYRLLTFE
jgi:tetratricopeptide (TPR) repeat protein